MELRELLAPKITLNKPFHWRMEEVDSDEPTRIKQLVDWELVLAADHVRSVLGNLTDDRWRAALPLLLDEFQQLLRDALDLMRELGEANDLDDRSYWDLPSISPHRQNRGFRDWVTLIELLRDAWLATYEVDHKRARSIASAWFDIPYSTFKRLALFAATKDGCIESTQWTAWLVMDNAWWLWSLNTRRETMRLLVLQGKSLAPPLLFALEGAVLAGPPRNMYRDDIDPEQWHRLVERSVWLYLAKLRKGGVQLGESAARRFNELSTANVEWKLAINEQEEFSHWMGGTSDPDFNAHRDSDIAPRKRREIVAWLKQPAPEQRPFYEDTWRETCRTRFFHSFLALCDLRKEGLWPSLRWREALQVWSEEGNVLRSWRFAAPLVIDMPDSVMLENIHGVTWWMQAVSKSLEIHEEILLSLCERVLRLAQETGTGILRNGEPINQPVTEAINHPIGHATQALLNVWFARDPGDNDSLSRDIEPFFTQLCDGSIEGYRHGRVLLASRLISLFRVDSSWTESHLLTFFDWTRNSIEAKAAWEGFLWSPRLYGPLLISFKTQFLDTARHYEELGEHKEQFAAILTHAALGSIDGYTLEEFSAAIGALPQDGLSNVAQTLSQALESAGDQREDFWKNRVQPFWHSVWPKSLSLASNRIGELLTRICMGARGEFPDALSAVVGWLRPIEHPEYEIGALFEAGLCNRFPSDALRLLDAVLDDQPSVPSELGQCLNAIIQAEPSLRGDHRYQRLIDYERRRGG